MTTIQAEVPLTFMANKYGYYIDEIEQFYVIAEASEYCTEVAAKPCRFWRADIMPAAKTRL